MSCLKKRVGVSELIILLILGYEPGFWAKGCGGAVAFRKQSSLWDEGYSWVLTILIVVMFIKIFL